MKIRHFTLIIIIFLFSNNLFASTQLDYFLKKESLNNNDDICILLLNSNDCSKCNVITKALDDILSTCNHYYLIISGIREKNINYYTHNILKIPNTKAKCLANDSLFYLLTQGLGSRVVCLHGTLIYLNKSLDEIRQPYRKQQFLFSIPFKDSLSIDEHIVPLNAKDFKVLGLTNDKFLFWDTHFKNLIVYNKNNGTQVGLFKLGSSSIKDIYIKYFSPKTNWDSAAKKIKEYEKANLTSFNFHQFQKFKDKFYILASFRLPTFRNKDTVDLYMKMFILQYDTSMKLCAQYCINEDNIPGAYYLNEFSGFCITNDTLYMNIQRYADVTKYDRTTKTLGAFKLNKEKGEYNIFDTFYTMPNFYSDNKMYYEYAENSMYLNSKTGEPIIIHTYTPDICDVSSKKSTTIKGISIQNSAKDITSDSVVYKFSFFFQINSNINNFIIWENGFYYLISENSIGDFKRKVKLSGPGLMKSDIKFFTDNEKLYAIALHNKDKVILYRYLLENFE